MASLKKFSAPSFLTIFPEYPISDLEFNALCSTVLIELSCIFLIVSICMSIVSLWSILALLPKVNIVNASLAFITA